MYNNILYPIDLQATTYTLTLPTAIEYARTFDATLHVMTVAPDFGMSIVGNFFPKDAEDKIIDQVRGALHEFTEKHIPEDIKVHHIVGQGTVYESIINASQKIDADLIIMGAHRLEIKQYLLGPNAARVVRHSDRPVLVIRDPDTYTS